MLQSLRREKQTLVVLSKEMIEAHAQVAGARTPRLGRIRNFGGS